MVNLLWIPALPHPEIALVCPDIARCLRSLRHEWNRAVRERIKHMQRKRRRVVRAGLCQFCAVREFQCGAVMSRQGLRRRCLCLVLLPVRMWVVRRPENSALRAAGLGPYTLWEIIKQLRTLTITFYNEMGYLLLNISPKKVDQNKGIKGDVWSFGQRASFPS